MTDYEYNLTDYIHAYEMPAATAVIGVCDDGAPLLVRFAADGVRALWLYGDSDKVLDSILTSLRLCNPEPCRVVGLDGLDAGLDIIDARQPATLDWLALGVGERLRTGRTKPTIIATIRDNDQAAFDTVLHDGPSVGVFPIVVSDGDMSYSRCSIDCDKQILYDGLAEWHFGLMAMPPAKP